ncbi:hypothetical protein N7481_011961 [Penicillium waksmanii]|uniref:uncharacterized protein n=1 Tax=Penicillium waksmanii TaxID=69791 RepID=UPI002548E679|nr:uncharacterized protein N7481_011961 [Penicillium waksmanii]KAJ5965247.1 hypothetical protein N7481_011961 [Penicillium waksmanii]
MTSAEAVIDVRDAMNAGFDGFALNTHSINPSDTWNINALNYLFAAASGTDFKLLISFDMSWGLDVTKLAAFLAPYASQGAYYKTNGQTFVSTFTGGTISNPQWNSGFIQPMTSTYGIKPFFVPDFDDFSGYPDGVFGSYPILNGVFSWKSAWPAPGNTPTNVSGQVDSAALQQARAAGKLYVMPMSPLQFKYRGSGQDWYRVGEVNLSGRMSQALQLQPYFVEVITWNDSGESHYVGDFWQEQIAGSNIGDYATGYNHKGWLQVITPFIKAYKAGTTSISQIVPPSTKPVGAFWYRPLLTTASCHSSIGNYQSARDAVNFAVILPSTGYTINLYSNSQLIGSFLGQKCLNYNNVLGLAIGGGQMIQVVDGCNHIVASATGTKSVLAQSANATCN